MGILHLHKQGAVWGCCPGCVLVLGCQVTCVGIDDATGVPDSMLAAFITTFTGVWLLFLWRRECLWCVFLRAHVCMMCVWSSVTQVVLLYNVGAAYALCCCLPLLAVNVLLMACYGCVILLVLFCCNILLVCTVLRTVPWQCGYPFRMQCVSCGSCCHCASVAQLQQMLFAAVCVSPLRVAVWAGFPVDGCCVQ